MRSENTDILQKAKNYCFLLLKFRARSETEIYDSLKRKKFDEEIIKAACKSLKEKGFIDDDCFAQQWIVSRLRKPFGLRRIRQELILKGIADNVIESNIAKITDNYSEEDIILNIAKIKLSKFTGQDTDKEKKRLYGYLLRRGFSSEVIVNVINELIT